MSRSIQIVGLTQSALDFVKDLEPLPSDTSTISTFLEMYEEKTPLRKWKHPERGVIREKLQIAPWSSGPILFYCLEWDIQNGAIFEMLSWVADPRIKNDFDKEKGIYWV